MSPRGWKKLLEVRPGIPNHSARTTTAPATRIHRIDGTASQAQTAYAAMNGHTSGRPKDASTSSANAQRGLRDRWQSIAPRHSDTISGSDCALRT